MYSELKKVTIKIYKIDLSTEVLRTHEKSNFNRQKRQPIKTMCKYSVRLESEMVNSVEMVSIRIKKC